MPIIAEGEEPDHTTTESDSETDNSNPDDENIEAAEAPEADLIEDPRPGPSRIGATRAGGYDTRQGACEKRYKDRSKQLQERIGQLSRQDALEYLSDLGSTTSTPNSTPAGSAQTSPCLLYTSPSPRD